MATTGLLAPREEPGAFCSTSFESLGRAEYDLADDCLPQGDVADAESRRQAASVCSLPSGLGARMYSEFFPDLHVLLPDLRLGRTGQSDTGLDIHAVGVENLLARVAYGAGNSVPVSYTHLRAHET